MGDKICSPSSVQRRIIKFGWILIENWEIPSLCFHVLCFLAEVRWRYSNTKKEFCNKTRIYSHAGGSVGRCLGAEGFWPKCYDIDVDGVRHATVILQSVNAEAGHKMSLTIRFLIPTHTQVMQCHYRTMQCPYTDLKFCMPNHLRLPNCPQWNNKLCVRHTFVLIWGITKMN